MPFAGGASKRVERSEIGSECGELVFLRTLPDYEFWSLAEVLLLGHVRNSRNE